MSGGVLTSRGARTRPVTPPETDLAGRGPGRTERPVMDAVTGKAQMHTVTLPADIRPEAKSVGPRPSRGEAEAAVRVLIAYAEGDDPAREGLLATPRRAVVAAYDDMLAVRRLVTPILPTWLDRTFSEIGNRYDDLFVLVRDILSLASAPRVSTTSCACARRPRACSSPIAAGRARGGSLQDRPPDRRLRAPHADRRSISTRQIITAIDEGCSSCRAASP